MPTWINGSETDHMDQRIETDHMDQRKTDRNGSFRLRPLLSTFFTNYQMSIEYSIDSNYEMTFNYNADTISGSLTEWEELLLLGNDRRKLACRCFASDLQ